MKVLLVLARLTLAAAALMPFVPDELSPITVTFVAVFAALLAVWAALVIQNGLRIYAPAGTTWLIGFLTAIVLSAFVAQLYGTEWTAWFRGAVPFLFLVAFLPFVLIAKQDPAAVVDAVHIACIVWLLKAFAVAGTGMAAVLAGEVQRLTHATEDWGTLTLPFGFIGLICSLFNPNPLARQLRWLLAPAFSLLAVLTVYRSQLLIVAVVWAFFLTRFGTRRQIAAAVAICSVGVVMIFSIPELGMIARISERFSETTGELEGSRMAELRFAFQAFLESPIYGKGLGYPVPVAVTFSGDIQAIMEAGVDSVGYIHNAIAYFAMDLGLFGLVCFFGFLSRALWHPRPRNPQLFTLWVAAVISLGALLVWFLVQPTFRHIQSNLLFAALVATLAALPRLQWNSSAR